MIQKVLIFFLSVYLCVGVSIASAVLNVNISDEEVLLWDKFQLKISINPEDISEAWMELDIKGIENFEIFSQSQSTSYTNINGQVDASLVFVLDLSPRFTGNFELGPISMSSWEQTLSAEEVFQVQVLDIDAKNQTSEQITKQWNKTGESEKNQTLTEKWEIKWLQNISFPWWGIAGLILLFFTLFYLALLEYIRFKNRPKKKIENIKQDDTPAMERNAEIIEILKKLEKMAGEIESWEFFRRYNIILREIFAKKWIKNAKSATLKELKNLESLWEDEYFKLFKKSYKHEFSEKNVSLETRKKYIVKLIDLLK